jgi:GNAT superfamily N-acetyltransferase
MTVSIEEVASARQRREFVRFPWQVYRDDPVWVPPLISERGSFIDSDRHPFYLHGAAQQFLARRGGRVAGTIQASDDPNYNAQHATNVGCFGLFESVADVDVARALFEAAANWLRARGRDRILGPIDYSTNYSCGLLVEGFGTPPRFLMNHHPPYYSELLEAWGLRKARDLYSWWFQDPLNLLAQWRKKADRLTSRGRISVRTLNVADLDGELGRIADIYGQAWSGNWGFVRPTVEELKYFAGMLATLAVPEMLLVAEADGRPVGISMTVPDLNEALRPLNGRLVRWGLPIGYLRFLVGCRRIRACRMFMLGVTEPYRRRGVAELLVLRSLDYGKNQIGYQGAELGWTLEDNQLVNQTIRAVGGERYKTYRIYEKSLV